MKSITIDIITDIENRWPIDDGCKIWSIGYQLTNVFVWYFPKLIVIKLTRRGRRGTSSTLLQHASPVWFTSKTGVSTECWWIQNPSLNPSPKAESHWPLLIIPTIFESFKLLQSDPDTATIFEKPPLVSFKWDKNLHNSLVKGSLSTELEPGTFKCSCKQCNTCPFITNTVSISGPKNPTQITNHFNCTSRNVIYCIWCTSCSQLYIGETGRRLGDCCHEHVLDV